VANISIICLAIVGITMWGKRLIQNADNSSSRVISQIKIGSRISLPDVDWELKNRTLLLMLSTTCHFCSESAGFYNQIVAETRSKGRIGLIAVFPQDIISATNYLDKIGVPLHLVHQASFVALGVPGTPTLILVSNKGIVENVWTGSLSVEKQREVMDITFRSQ
jgi:hypothetical protein